MNIHLSACSGELKKFIQNKDYSRFLDCTFGVGNHSNIILNYASKLQYIYGIDYDIRNRNYSDKIDNHLFKFFHMNFANAPHFFMKNNKKFDFIIFDFGIHDIQMYNNCSYMKNMNINVNFDNTTSSIYNSAINIINTWDEIKLCDLFKYLSDEPLYKKVSKNICIFRKNKKIISTKDLKDMLSSFYEYKHLNKCLGRIIQSLRMYVNKEIENIVCMLQNIHYILDSNSCLFFVTFHSIEDRIIKNFSKGKSLCYGNENLFKFLKIKNIDYVYKCSKTIKNIISGIDDKKRNSLRYKTRILYS